MYWNVGDFTLESYFIPKSSQLNSNLNTRFHKDNCMTLKQQIYAWKFFEPTHTLIWRLLGKEYIKIFHL